MKNKRIIAAAMATGMAVSLAACGGSASTTDTTGTADAATTEAADAATGEGTGFTVQLGPNPETLDPALNAAVDGGNTLITIEEPLLIIDENNEIQPGQAESYEVSDDGLVWTFHLRDGLKWSDGSDLTAEDYNAEGLLNYPVLADVGSIAINAGTSADGLKAAKSAALWLYSNGAGEDALTETLGVVTPWNTAAGTTAVTAMQVQQVGTGILPGVALDTAAADALTANELTLQDSEKHTKAERTAFVDGALAALGAE